MMTMLTLPRHARAALLAAFVVGGCSRTAPPPAPAPAPSPASERVLPGPVPVPPQFERAIARGTRTSTGEPGPRYWRNSARYVLRSRLDPAAKRLDGSAEIVYRNHSPDTLRQVVLELAQNLHQPGAVRNEPNEVTGGMEIRNVRAQGQPLSELTRPGAGYRIDGTRMYLTPPTALLPGDSIRLAMDFGFRIAAEGASGRMGYNDADLFFLAYWYPQVSVYDDVYGWFADPFLGTGEFYHEFASYDVSVEAPAGWIVAGTGTLQNPTEVLTPEVLARLKLAVASDTVVRVVSAADTRRATRTGTGGMLRWHFRADSVSDVAFSATSASNWDATRASVGERNGAPAYTEIHAFWRPAEAKWKDAARYEKHAIEFLSRYTGFPYPWAHMTAVEGEGIVGGGMEYPMMTLISGYTGAPDDAFYGVIAHELAHMWVPMIDGSNERRYGWLDEGITEFNENQAKGAFFPGSNANLPDQNNYLRVARAGGEGEMMRWSDFQYTSTAYLVATYLKPASLLVALRGVLGEETFNRAYREFIRRWAYKHPYPWDLWNTFNSVSGRNLDWFWRSWYFETWTLDQAVESVASGAGGTTITVRDVGMVPMPVRLAITLANGEVLRREIPVDVWLAGARTATINVPAGQAVTRVEIDPEMVFPDVDRSNNVWPR
jgi:hypothetical protein